MMNRIRILEDCRDLGAKLGRHAWLTNYAQEG